jgi:hypothetical protein
MSQQLSDKSKECILKIKQVEYLAELENSTYELSIYDLQNKLNREVSTLLYQLSDEERNSIDEIMGSESEDELRAKLELTNRPIS